MQAIPDSSVDLILCDLPYGTTECSWDVIIPFEKLWASYERIIKPTGSIVLFAGQPFTSHLICSNINLFRYTLVWNKSRVSRFAQAKYRFLNEHEDIVVFSKGKCSENSLIKPTFNPQGLRPIEPKICADHAHALRPNRNSKKSYVQTQTGYPKSILKFPSDAKPVHPTQKPVALLEYLIQSYTNKGDTVLDNCMGSGSTGVAAVNTERNFTGIEIDAQYFVTAKNRIGAAKNSKIPEQLEENKPMPLQIESGKTYKTYNGRFVTIKGPSGTPTFFLGVIDDFDGFGPKQFEYSLEGYNVELYSTGNNDFNIEKEFGK